MATVLPASGFAWDSAAAAQIPATYPLQASATITGGQVLAVTGAGTVGPAGASSTAVIGYAIDDAANGAMTNVLTYGPVLTCTASGSITAGAQCIAAAAGQVATIGAATFEKIIGTALDTVTNGQLVRVVMKS